MRRAPLIVIPLVTAVFFWWYTHSTKLPRKIVISSGPENGRYHDIALSLKEEIEDRFGIEVDVLPSRGSVQNMQMLRDHKADFVLYQPDTVRLMFGQEDPETHTAFATNLFSEVMQVFVRTETRVADAGELGGRRVSVGQADSGDYASCRILLEHLGLDTDGAVLKNERVDYASLVQAFSDGNIDAAVVTAGIHAQFLQHLVDTADVQLVRVPYAEALARRHTAFWPFTIPTGYYRTGANPVPAEDVKTVSMRAALLTREDVSNELVEDVVSIVMSETFQREHELKELFSEGVDFATAKPEFPIHAGAEHYFNPELKPPLNSDFVEATEGLRSFVVSILVAIWLFGRWLRTRRDKSQAHRLDQLMTAILDIEHRQMQLDEAPGGHDIAPLQRMLDELTDLRRRALGEFSFHEINDDRSVECFLTMCFSLSEKISAKLTRQRLEKAIGQLGDKSRMQSTIADGQA